MPLEAEKVGITLLTKCMSDFKLQKTKEYRYDYLNYTVGFFIKNIDQNFKML